MKDITFKKKIKIYLTLIFLYTFSTFGQAKNKISENCETSKNKNSKVNEMSNNQKNVLGTDLILASKDPITGFFRTGFCSTDSNDKGVHVIAAVVTDKFLKYSLSKGNDLISAYPANGFPGLKDGNVWCLCAIRWKEALKDNVAPPVILEATNIKALEFVSFEDLKKNEFINSKK